MSNDISSFLNETREMPQEVIAFLNQAESEMYALYSCMKDLYTKPIKPMPKEENDDEDE